MARWHVKTKLFEKRFVFLIWASSVEIYSIYLKMAFQLYGISFSQLVYKHNVCVPFLFQVRMNTTLAYGISSSHGNITAPTICRDEFGAISNQYIVPVLCVFGILGNVLSLTILMSDRIKEAPYIYIRALAISDTSALLVSFPFIVFCGDCKYYNWIWYQIYIFIPVMNYFLATGVWITVTMTIERFIIVKFPLWARSRCTRFGIYIRIFMILVAALLLCIPRFFAYTHTNGHPDNYQLRPTAFKESSIYSAIDVFAIVSLHFLPLLILGVINVFLIYEVRNATTVRKRLNIRNNHETEFQNDQIRLTVTLISIVVLSLCFIGPATVSDILMYAGFNKSNNCVYQFIRNLANFFLFCMLSLNFILYCAFNKRFVAIMKSFLRSGRLNRDAPSYRLGRSFRTTEGTYLWYHRHHSDVHFIA